MKGKFMIIAALLGSLTLGACVDSVESPSVTAVRTAKAEALKSVATLNNAKAAAEAIIAAAEAELKAAEAAYQQALAAQANADTEAQKIANKLAQAQAEAKIERIKAQLEIDLVNKSQELATAIEAAAAVADEKLSALYKAYGKAYKKLGKAEEALLVEELELAELEAAADLWAEYYEDQYDEALLEKTLEVAAAEARYAYLLDTKEQIEALGVPTLEELEDELEEVDNQMALLENEITISEAELQIAEEAVPAAYEEFYAGDFWLGVQAFKAISTLEGTTVALDEDELEGLNAKGNFWGFYPAIVNAEGEFEQDTTSVEPVALFVNAKHQEYLDEEETILIPVQDAIEKVSSEGVDAYITTLEMLSDTSEATRKYEVAEAAMDAYLAKYDTVATFVGEWADKADELQMSKAKNAATQRRLVYMKEVLEDAEALAEIADAYKKEIADLDKEIKALADEAKSIDSLINKHEADMDAYEAKLGGTGSAADIVADLNTLLEAYEEALEDYVAQEASIDEEIEVLEELEELSAEGEEYVEFVNANTIEQIEIGLELAELMEQYSVASDLWFTIDETIDNFESGDVAISTLLEAVIDEIEALEASAFDDGSLAQMHAELDELLAGGAEAYLEAYDVALAQAMEDVAQAELKVAVAEARVDMLLEAIETFIGGMDDDEEVDAE